MTEVEFQHLSWWVAMRASMAFIFLSAVGVAEAIYHAWLENAFTANVFQTNYSVYGSFLGIPYWVFGIVWFPLMLVIGVWTTDFGQTNLNKKLLIILSLGNAFTGYLWFLDLVIIGAFTAVYVGLYVTNYALTGLVIAQNWTSPMARDFFTGTVIGMVIGVFFGAFGVAAFGIAGGIVGAVGSYTSTK